MGERHLKFHELSDLEGGIANIELDVEKRQMVLDIFDAVITELEQHSVVENLGDGQIRIHSWKLFQCRVYKTSNFGCLFGRKRIGVNWRADCHPFGMPRVRLGWRRIVLEIDYYYYPDGNVYALQEITAVYVFFSAKLDAVFTGVRSSENAKRSN